MTDKIQHDISLDMNYLNGDTQQSDNKVIDIQHTITQTTVDGQLTNLAEPILLTGRLHTSQLLDEVLANCSSQKGEHASNKSKPLQIGIDEAGRGPLLGEVVVAAAILPFAWAGELIDAPLKNTPLSKLTDSKKLSEKKRDLLYPLIKQYALGFVIAHVPASVIDQINILQASLLGMRLSAESLMAQILQNLPDDLIQMLNLDGLNIEVLCDGNRCPPLATKALDSNNGRNDIHQNSLSALSNVNVDWQAWVKGDARHSSIAAASVLAKVERDRGMYELAKQYPNYGIDQHKGYPTKAHLQAIQEYGVLPMHRRSYAPIKNVCK